MMTDEEEIYAKFNVLETLFHDAIHDLLIAAARLRIAKPQGNLGVYLRLFTDEDMRLTVEKDDSQ